MPRAPRSRKFVFTLNNFTTTNIDFPADKIKYAVWQHEQGANNTPHLQGLVVGHNNLGFGWLRRLIPGAHWEAMRGTLQEAEDYCTKLDTRVSGPFIFGRKPAGAGARTDIETCKAVIDEAMENGSGNPLEIVREEYHSLWLRYGQRWEAYIGEKWKHDDSTPEVTVVVGPSDSGKTHYCNGELPATPGSYWKPTGKWWDGYTGQKHVVIDEFYGWIAWSVLLRILDKYPLRVETKGSTVTWRAKHIFITSNGRPDTWYNYNNNNLRFSALQRRVTKWIYIPRRGVISEYDNYESFCNQLDTDNYGMGNN